MSGGGEAAREPDVAAATCLEPTPTGVRPRDTAGTYDAARELARADRPPPPGGARCRRVPVGDAGRACAVRLRALELHRGTEGRARRARARADRSPPPAPFAHPPRPRGGGRISRPRAPRPPGARFRDGRFAPRRPEQARSERTSPVRRELRFAVGRA